MEGKETTAENAPGRALTAAEKRAARRARVLAGSGDRMKLVSGEISSLKDTQEGSAESKLLDEGVAELMKADTTTAQLEQNNAKTTSDLKFPPKIDPAQRRRDAALRRQKKESVVQEILGTPAASTMNETQAHDKSTEHINNPVIEDVVASKAQPTTAAFSRHSLALKLRAIEEKVVIILIIAAAAYLAFNVDLRNILADLRANDHLFASYQDMLARGVPMDSIRQQFEREQLEPAERERLEQMFVQQLKTEPANISLTNRFLPNFWDLSDFFYSLVQHPPIIVCVFLGRLLITSLSNGLHFVMGLPEVKNPQEDNMGFIVNLVLSTRPAFKKYLVQLRKSADDVFFFIYVLVLLVATRALWLE